MTPKNNLTNFQIFGIFHVTWLWRSLHKSRFHSRPEVNRHCGRFLLKLLIIVTGKSMTKIL